MVNFDKSLDDFAKSPDAYWLRITQDDKGNKVLKAEAKTTGFWDFFIIRAQGVEQYKLAKIVEALKGADFTGKEEILAKLKQKIINYEKKHTGEKLNLETKTDQKTKTVATTILTKKPSKKTQESPQAQETHATAARKPLKEEAAQPSKPSFEQNLKQLESWLRQRDPELTAKANVLRNKDQILQRELLHLDQLSSKPESYAYQLQRCIFFERSLNEEIDQYNKEVEPFEKLKKFQSLQENLQSAREFEQGEKLTIKATKYPDLMTLRERQELLRTVPRQKEILAKQIELLLSLRVSALELSFVNGLLAQKQEELSAAKKIELASPENRWGDKPLTFSIFNSATGKFVEIQIAPTEKISQLKEKIAREVKQKPENIAILYAGVALHDDEVITTLLHRGASPKNESQAFRWVEMTEHGLDIQEKKPVAPQAPHPDTQISNFVEEHLASHVISNFSKEMTEKAKFSENPPIIDKLLPELKMKFSNIEESKLKKIILESYLAIAARGFNEAYKADIVDYRKALFAKMYSDERPGEYDKIFHQYGSVAGFEQFRSQESYVTRRAEDNPFIFPDDPSEFHTEKVKIFIEHLKKALSQDLNLQIDDIELEKLAKEALREIIRAHNIEKAKTMKAE